jgi:hypothetical protein
MLNDPTALLLPARRLVLLLLPAVLLSAQTDHTTGFIGTWKLNVAKSKFTPAPAAPQSATVTVGDGTFKFAGVAPDGKSNKWSHPWPAVKEVPIDGMENGTIISKLHGRTMDDTYKVDGKTFQTVHAVLSPDGNTVTATVDSTDKEGRHMHAVEIWDKQ